MYDPAVLKTSVKNTSSSFSIYLAVRSVCLAFESQRNYPGTVLRGAVSTLEKNIQSCTWEFTFSVKLKKMVISRRRYTKNMKEMHGIKKKKARQGRAKVFVFGNQLCNFCCIVAAVASLILSSLAIIKYGTTFNHLKTNHNDE